mmetsp:Transcript_36129/g.116850  ORF Transcript_36129/g.116850 Transcript_36129/m.116850 type:complete len:536 (+) Transcript_36129:272-1879(+)
MEELLALLADHLAESLLVLGHLLHEGRPAATDDADGQEPSVFGVADCDCGDRDALWHLHNGVQAVLAVHGGGLDGDADDGQGGHGGDHTGQVGRPSGSGDDAAQSPRRGALRVRHHPLRGAVGADDVALVGDAELLKDLAGVNHRREVGVGAHDDADQGLRGWDVAAVSLAIHAKLDRVHERLEAGLELGRAVGGDVDVAHLPPSLAPVLAVPMHGRPLHPHGDIQGAEGGRHLFALVPQDVDHGGGANAHGSVPEGQAGDRAEVVLELRAGARVLCVVAGIVGAGRDLVEHHGAVGEEEELYAEDAGGAAAEGRDGVHGDGLGEQAGILLAAGRGDDDPADGVALDGRDGRVRLHVTVGGLDDHDGELVDEGNPPLGVHAPSLSAAGELVEERLCILDFLEHGVAPPVVALLAGLEHQRQAHFVGGGDDAFDGGAVEVRRTRNAMLLEVVLLHEFVLDDPDGVRARLAVHALGLQCGQRLDGDVLDLERHHVAALGQLLERLEVLQPSLHNPLVCQERAGSGVAQRIKDTDGET